MIELAACKRLGFNAVRALSIIALILVFVSSITVMVDDVNAVQRPALVPSGTLTDASGHAFHLHPYYIQGSTVPIQPAGMFFAILSRLFIIVECVVLILSELGWPERLFVNFLPILGPDYGVGTLGMIQILIAAASLSHHISIFPLVSAFFLFAVGCLNLLLGSPYFQVKKSRLIFGRKTKNESPPGYEERTKPVIFATSDIFSSKKGRGYPQSDCSDDKASYGFGTQAYKNLENADMLITKPVASVLKYESAQSQRHTFRP